MSGLSLPGDDLALVITHCLESTEQRNWALARESSPGGWLLGAGSRSKELKSECDVLCCLMWPGLQMKPFRIHLQAISDSDIIALHYIMF